MFLRLLALICPLFIGELFASMALVRIKDIAYIEGVRDNMLVGYGLVVGLNGTGDTLRASPFTKATLVSMLDRLGVGTRLADGADRALNTRNVAAVMVTAKLPPFARQGSPIDVTVSAMGDAKSLRGGTLLVTPLLGADSEVYAVSQGSLASSSFEVSGRTGSSTTKGVPTTAMISNGATVERESPYALSDLKAIKLSLRNPDLTTARRIEEAVNENVAPIASAMDPTTIQLTIPERYQKRPMPLLTDIENLRVVPAQTARIVLNESEGIIVMGNDVRVSTVAVSHGSLVVTVKEEYDVSQPQAPLVIGGSGDTKISGNQGGAGGAGEGASGGGDINVGSKGGDGIQTVVIPKSTVAAQETGKRMIVLESSVRLQDLVDALNALQLPASDLSAVIRSIHAAGAIHAQLEVI